MTTLIQMAREIANSLTEISKSLIEIKDALNEMSNADYEREIRRGKK